jgi:hypothetical protein
MIIENKYVVVINDLGDCIIHNYFNAVKIETNSKIIPEIIESIIKTK